MSGSGAGEYAPLLILNLHTLHEIVDGVIPPSHHIVVVIGRRLPRPTT